jgi:hypothetical protein
LASQGGDAERETGDLRVQVPSRDTPMLEVIGLAYLIFVCLPVTLSVLNQRQAPQHFPSDIEVLPTPFAAFGSLIILPTVQDH